MQYACEKLQSRTPLDMVGERTEDFILDIMELRFVRIYNTTSKVLLPSRAILIDIISSRTQYIVSAA